MTNRKEGKLDARSLLAEAASLIRDGGHCNRVDARDDTGTPVLPHHPRARARGVTGALLVSGRAAAEGAFVVALHAYAEAVGIFDYPHPREWSWDEMPVRSRELCEKIWAWEDVPLRSAKHVLGAFDRAIEYVSPRRKKAA